MASRRTAPSKRPTPIESEQSERVNEAAEQLFEYFVFPPRLRSKLTSPEVAQDFLRFQLSTLEAITQPKPLERPALVYHKELILDIVGQLRPEELALLPERITQKANEFIKLKFSTPPVLVSANLKRLKGKTHGRKMVERDKGFIYEGVSYLPLSAAAPLAQAPASTLLDWIKKKTEFDGRPLQSYHFAPANRYLVSEESIERAANRFVKWPSQEPAGPVTIGETDNQSGYIGLTDAAHAVGVDHHTMWRWTTKGTAPTDEPLQVIKCPASEQYYVHEKDVSRLKKLVPRSGLRRGRRPQLAL